MSISPLTGSNSFSLSTESSLQTSSSSSSVNQAAISVFSGTPSSSSSLERNGYKPLQNSITDFIEHHYKPNDSSVFDPTEKLRTILDDTNQIKELFQLALQKKHTALLLLLDKKIDKEDVNKALIFFSKEKITNYLAIERLIARGASLDAQDNEGNTPLILAVKNNCSELVEMLLKNKANENIKNNNKETALTIAKKLNNKQIINILSKKYIDKLFFVTNQLEFLSKFQVTNLKPNDPIHSIIRNFHALMKETFSEREKETINDNSYKIREISEQKRAYYKSRFGFLKELFSKLGNLFNWEIRRFISSGDLGLELVNNWEQQQKSSAES